MTKPDKKQRMNCLIFLFLFLFLPAVSLFILWPNTFIETTHSSYGSVLKFGAVPSLFYLTIYLFVKMIYFLDEEKNKGINEMFGQGTWKRLARSIVRNPFKKALIFILPLTLGILFLVIHLTRYGLVESHVFHFNTLLQTALSFTGYAVMYE